MAIELNDNIHNKTSKPDSSKYFNLAGVPYTDAAQVLAQIPFAERHEGLPVRIGRLDHEFAANLSDLIPKFSNIVINNSFTGIHVLTQAEYDAIVPPVATVLYFIK